MKYLVLDTESTGAQRESKGSALDPRNRLCHIGIRNTSNHAEYSIEYEVGTPFGDAIRSVESAINNSSTIVLFNAKHDLHWLRRYGLWNNPRPIWDCQLAEFIINGQTEPFPSLHKTSLRYGGHGKLDIVSKEYWERGLDTDEVPEQILSTYLSGDVLETERVFLGQLAKLEGKDKLHRLIWLSCQDEIITEEMEWNGLKFDMPALLKQADKLEQDIIKIDHELFSLVGDSRINWDSPKQVSGVLYGGNLGFSEREDYLFHYAGNKKPPIVKSRQVEKLLVLPRLVEPIQKTESSDGESWSTADKVLRQLKATAKAKRIVELILERRSSQTQINRYFRGIPTKYAEMGWQDNIVHGQLHHCVAATGRMSSSNPNQQNIDKKARHCLVTRFKI